MKYLILITKQESLTIKSEYPDAYIVRTCKNKSKRHRYYCPEIFGYLRLISDTNPDAKKFVSSAGRKKHNINLDMFNKRGW